MSMPEELLRSYGLWALFFGAAFEGDVTLLLAGMMIHLGVWPAAEALPIAAAGGLAGDTFYFWLGHGAGRFWLMTAHGQRVLPRIEKFAARYGLKSLFFGRYIYGARVATMFFWGMRGLPAARFLLLDGLNCCIWALLFMGLGFAFSSSLTRWLGELQRIETSLLIGLLSFMALLGLRHYLAEISRAPGAEHHPKRKV